MTRIRLGLLPLILILGSGCKTSETVSGTNRSVSRYNVDPSGIVLPSDKRAREELERVTINQIMTRAKPPEVPYVRAFIAGDSLGRIAVVRGDKELARLFSTLYALRDANVAVTETSANVVHRQTQVTLVLVPSFKGPNRFARIVRTPGEQGRNLVFLSEQALTADNVDVALTALSRSRLKWGDVLQQSVTLILQNGLSTGSSSTNQLGRAAELVTRLRAAEISDIIGYGRARSLSWTLPAEP